MALTQINVDDEALAEAMRLSGMKTKKDTVSLALREFAARRDRDGVVRVSRWVH